MWVRAYLENGGILELPEIAMIKVDFSEKNVKSVLIGEGDRIAGVKVIEVKHVDYSSDYYLRIWSKRWNFLSIASLFIIFLLIVIKLNF